MQLNQVKAIVTGGASGLGHAVAQRIVAAGGRVALFDVNEEKGQSAATETTTGPATWMVRVPPVTAWVTTHPSAAFSTATTP